jgi:hypothetical protein
MIGLMVDENLEIGDQIIFDNENYKIVKIGNIRRESENLKLVYVENITPRVKKIKRNLQ